jgi:DNA-directed RNA polymerase specialized sigma24 family protein
MPADTHRGPVTTRRELATLSSTSRQFRLCAAPEARAVAISLSGNVDRANDLVQEALLRAWANLDSFEPGTNMAVWLFTILRNLSDRTIASAAARWRMLMAPMRDL